MIKMIMRIDNQFSSFSCQAFPLDRVGGEGRVVVVVVVMLLCPVFPVRDDKLVVMKGKVGEMGAPQAFPSVTRAAEEFSPTLPTRFSLVWMSQMDKACFQT
jgi:hypothetical protein